ncbi:hypothetical protein Malapachy_1744 [Malassezia pachydermatis]|uniref:Uncharacterized protein n=1 Tax=Malassezia pachydermatis TaxID=77020 RepID=A0A0N0RS40_9BASI|nr:hypothetical protein Malapachy_1744 [Malassezia pachydermatis]KOS13672.1 hypothetical protein Malapachy_1744 [Malassezia pachydermatis]
MKDASTIAAFYRGREEPLHIEKDHIDQTLARYLDAMEAQVRDAQASTAQARALSRTAPRDPTRIQELSAAVRYAKRLASASPMSSSAHLSERLQALSHAAENLQSLVTQSPCHVLPSDEFWDDYLYADLQEKHAPVLDTPAPAPEQTDDSAPADDETKVSVPSSTPEPASTLRQRRLSTSKNATTPPVFTSATDKRVSALQSDRSLQDALSSELLRMAGVLKQNTVAFTEALERDRQLVEETSGRLDQNLGLMTRTRGQLGVFSKKARSMGWFTLGSIASVLVCWVVMFIVIKLT